ncbi:DUF2075 domain-containing protein [Ramlibacter sp.]|uniref:DUF2075 domain-containing protein n=1 Tax=Ramlibacter sp. TaxID=1917967 RepID=UPI002CD926F5|nr:DUF2075 domain-containing protein [Ramlibacter sp.]HWI83492.1 DUF2075 domain-containing protein [Ramlibacter sp.]
MKRAYYSAPVSEFLGHSAETILGTLTACSEFPVEAPQRDAWLEQVQILKKVLAAHTGRGRLYLEYAVPRLGRRIDAVALLDHVVFVLEFKVGESRFLTAARDQVWDYALDLKNFHASTHDKAVAPILVATRAPSTDMRIEVSAINDGVFRPIFASEATLPAALRAVLQWSPAPPIGVEEWEAGRYLPAPTIVEAARALYAGHGVEEIARSGAGKDNLNLTSSAVDRIIEQCKAQNQKAICFVTGVPGAGKTLIGLNVATKHTAPGELHSVFLSGNGPLVSVLREALARDHVEREHQRGKSVRKGEALSRVRAFVQNVHHFRDEYLRDPGPPSDHVAVFDEAQRAWNLQQTAMFMQRKKSRPGFAQSEPEFLISCLDRHQDWAVIVCLVGGGQEINTGEAGITEWIQAIRRSFEQWHVFMSPELHGSEYDSGNALQTAREHALTQFNPDLHLSVSMRSFRAEHVSDLAKSILDLDVHTARQTFDRLRTRYPIVLCRNLTRAKRWLREQARGTERFGIVVSSQAQRLRPHAIDVRSPMDPVHWFLDDKDDVRSSYYLEEVATEFHVQGLELDWTCVVWDGDFRHVDNQWEHFSFVGSRWQNIKMPERRAFQKNAYRVLLTRARQGMVIVVPEGDDQDSTRLPAYYDGTFSYLRSLGLSLLE